MASKPKFQSVEELRQAVDLSRMQRAAEDKVTLMVSAGTCGQARGSLDVIAALEKVIRHEELQDQVKVKVTGCHGFCEAEPNIIIQPQDLFYQHVGKKHAKQIIHQTALKHERIEELLYKEPVNGRTAIKESEIPFYSKQQRVVLGDNVQIDPTDIGEYYSIGGYLSLAKALSEMTPSDVIETVQTSGLRGRGGAGFPTGKKWAFTRRTSGDVKYIICNADEGDPGAYMDRSLMEGNPHRVLEGMIIGGYAIGAREGYVYIRDEYPLALQNITQAVEDARTAGMLGEGILGSGFDFEVRVVKGAGAFVCGEETAMMRSIEGKVGEPRQRPPFPSVQGLWKRPTNINNVETWANIPLIIDKGPEWYAQIGTEDSKGTKIFSLVGKINNTGLVEVPMGITLREIIYDIGGGIPDDKEFKAVQTGGPSGGCLPKEKLELPIDYESLTDAGSIMGSGGMIVMDENTCMVDVAKYFLNFLRDESCGKCLSCREGTHRMWEIVTDITEGAGKPEDIELLEALATAVKDSSMCGLGQTAANPVLSTLRYFREEYESHIKDRACPAGVCKALIEYSIVEDKCTGCLACLKVCPENAITGELKQVHVLDKSKCIKCGACYEACKFDAIHIE
jgi:NADH-quinone oxidoreductase subunit F